MKFETLALLVAPFAIFSVSAFALPASASAPWLQPADEEWECESKVDDSEVSLEWDICGEGLNWACFEFVKTVCEEQSTGERRSTRWKRFSRCGWC